MDNWSKLDKNLDKNEIKSWDVYRLEVGHHLIFILFISNNSEINRFRLEIRAKDKVS